MFVNNSKFHYTRLGLCEKRQAVLNLNMVALLSNNLKPVRKFKFIDIVFSLLTGVGIGFVALIISFAVLGIHKTNDDSSLMITLSSTIIYLSVFHSFWLFLIRKNNFSLSEMG